ncbi:MAG: sigma-70 family RNA polymerase sigma factor [Phycisphaerae bacterium]|nr:sigma-70 family RNA polymerase sigma factor [Phycisphaerae bacterium]
MADDVIECDLESRVQTLDEDLALVRAAQQDTQAAGRLYDRYYAQVFGYVYHCTLDRPTTEDLTSNVFLAAFRHLGRYRWQRIPFRAWLFRIATNEVRTYCRRRKCSRTARRRLEQDSIVDSGPSADAEPAATEQYRIVHQALLELRPKYRTAIILRYFEDRTITEIAGITGNREGTVKSRLHRGLARLQDVLAKRGILPE